MGIGTFIYPVSQHRIKEAFAVTIEIAVDEKGVAQQRRQHHGGIAMLALAACNRAAQDIERFLVRRQLQDVGMHESIRENDVVAVEKIRSDDSVRGFSEARR
jgi:hypothetical protein